MAIDQKTQERSVNIPNTNKPKIVIVGGGFAGIELARSLRKLDVQIILIDKNNYHTFQPLLYQVATSSLEPDSIAYPFREIFRGQENFIFRMTEVLEILTEQKKLKTSIGEIDYDYLIIASGSRTNYFNMKDFQEFSIPMKSITEAIAIRNLVLENMEKALLVKEISARESLMNIVIVGGGATGVEMAGSLVELKLHILPKDYPELDIKRMQIYLVDMEDRLLRNMTPEASNHAAEFFRKFNVNLWLKTKVLSFDGKKIILSNGKEILTDTVIWAAGVSGALVNGIKTDSIVKGRIKVDQFNKVEGYSNIYAIGDIAAVITEKTPDGHPMLAPVAIQQATNLGNNFGKILVKQPLNPFVYKDPGVMATIGRNQAVVDVKGLKFHGILAWFMWLFVHLMALVGFRNRVVVFVNWAWSYFSFDRGLRLIIKPTKG